MAGAGADTDDDWRLCALLHGDGPALVEPHGIVARFRGEGPQVVQDAEHAIGPGVVLTHDGHTLFAYARDRATLDGARETLARAIERDGLIAQVTIAHWEDDLGQWTQVEPPPTGEASAAHERALRDAHAPTTQTFTVLIGRQARAEVVDTMRRYARERNLTFGTVEHPHLLSTQMAFTVSGTRHDVDEFRAGLDAEERQSIRTAEGMSFGL